jgi:hypothetical protein
LLTRCARHVHPAIAAVFILIANATCQAQSCALCYTQAGGAGHRFIQGLRSGILVLIIPPMFMSVGITVLAYRKRNRCNDADSTRESDSDW